MYINRWIHNQPIKIKEFVGNKERYISEYREKKGEGN